MQITVSANAKLNLFLNITGKRDDGYHTLATVMHTLDLHDSLELSLSDTPGIRLTTTLPYVPCDERNSTYKAAACFLSRLKTAQGVRIHVIKRIPVAGGLGGSSTDGAGALSGLNLLFGKPFSERELLAMASTLSADMPFCLTKGAALCEGIGEIITPLPSLSCCYAVIIKARFSLNTGMMYTAFDDAGVLPERSVGPTVDAVKANDVAAVAASLYNAFSPQADALRPELCELRRRLTEYGALGVLMSGSGSCVYGLFDRENAATKAFDALSEESFTVYRSRLI